MTPGRRSALPRAAPAVYAEEVLRETAQLLVTTGHAPQALVRRFGVICGEISAPAREFDPQEVPYFSGLSHIIAHWYTDPKYLDAADKPRPLPLHARGVSLASLIRRVFPQKDANEVAHSLVASGAVRRAGTRYVPVRRHVWWARTGPSVHVHGLTSLMGMLRTVGHNISRTQEEATLLERAATNPYIPIRVLPTIHRRIKREVSGLLVKLDGLLRLYEVAPGSEPTTRVGVGAYAYEDPIVTGSRPGDPPPRRGGAARRALPRSARRRKAA
jgi:hypothetical protein